MLNDGIEGRIESAARVAVKAKHLSTRMVDVVLARRPFAERWSEELEVLLQSREDRQRGDRQGVDKEESGVRS